MGNGGQGLPAFAQSSAMQNAMMNAAQGGQYSVPQGGMQQTMAVPQGGTFAGAGSAPIPNGTPLQPISYPNPQGMGNDPYSSFLQALNQIQAANPISAIQSATMGAKAGGAPRQPTGNINRPGG